jgi:hypothetical protein
MLYAAGMNRRAAPACSSVRARTVRGRGETSAAQQGEAVGQRAGSGLQVVGFAQPRRRSIAVILNDPAHPLNQFVQNHGDFVRPAFVFGFIPPLGLFIRPFANAGCRLCRPQVVAAAAHSVALDVHGLQHDPIGHGLLRNERKLVCLCIRSCCEWRRGAQ